MSFSATRLTCFALIAAIEEDMRATIETHLGMLPIYEAVPQERAERAQLRRRKDGLSVAETLPGLLPYLDFADSYELLMSKKGELADPVVEGLKNIRQQVERLIDIRNRVAHTRPMEIDDSAHLIDISKTLLSYAPNYWENLKETVEHLSADPSYVLGLRIKLPTDPDPGPQHNLPIPDFDETGFFGRKQQLRRIKKAIKGAYPVVSVLGDGGIGKTSIALKAAYELLEDPGQPFEAFVWVTAKATILTTSEIQRINGAIETSLGLFAEAASQLGGQAVDDPVEEVLGYLENFKVLLILDNLETVLDTRLREFLLDLPLGSKVLITSRIGLGIENPVQLQPLELDDSKRLLRSLARVRGVDQLGELPDQSIDGLARKMGGHPAFIRWFVAGVQAGQRPEDLVGDNALLLDFCMSNVYEYLSEDAKAVVRSMQVLPGSRNQAELAFLNNYPAGQIQAALLELLTTNFVQMSSQSSGDTLDTTYKLSDFGRRYLDKQHPVAQDERRWLLSRSEELRELGSRLTAANTASPYSIETVNVRGVGDIHVARLLRDAVRSSKDDPAGALRLCSEAQVLAPSYYEGWRVEAYVRSVTQDQTAAIASYERSLELAPDSAVLHYHYGSFLVNEAGDPARGLGLLQAAARYDPESAAVAGQIVWAHYCLGNMQQSIDSSRHILGMKNANQGERRAAMVVALRAGAIALRGHLDTHRFEDAAELLESIVDLAEMVSVESLSGESYDRIAEIRYLAISIADSAEGYAVTKTREYISRLTEQQRRSDSEGIYRRLGDLKTLKSDKGFGFVRSQGVDYFFHYRDLVDVYDSDRLSEGVRCVFYPVLNSPRGPRAEKVRILG